MNTHPRRLSTVLGLSFGLLAAFLLPAVALAQDRPALEIGTYLGFSVVSFAEGDGESVTVIGIPGGEAPLFSGSSLYLSFFPSNEVVIEPEVSILRLSDEGDSFTLLGLSGGVEYLFRGQDEASPFVGAKAGLMRESESDSDSETDWLISGSAGYRVPVRDALSVTLEARYRRWFDGGDFGSDMNEYTFRIGIGAIVPRE